MTISTDLAAELVRLARQLAETQQRVTTLERGQNAATLSSASIEGGALTINDADGVPQIVLGAQADGTWAHVALPSAPVPPLPSSPQVSPSDNGLVVSWDGLMEDGSPPLADFAGVQMHVSPDLYFTPTAATLQSTMVASGTRPVIGLTAGVTYYVTLLTVNAAGQLSAPTTYVGATPLTTTEAIPPGSITADLLDANIVVAGIVDATVVNAPTLLGSTILGYAASPRRGPLAEGFEGGTGGWTGMTNATTGQDTTIFATEGVASLKITSLATGAFAAWGPARATVPGDPVTVVVDLYTASILSQVYVGIRWEDSSHTLIYETDCADFALAAGSSTTLAVGDSGPAMTTGAPADAAWYRVVVGDHGPADVIASALYADFVRESGNLFFAASPAGGTDDLGSVYDQGVEIDSQPGQTSAYTVQDAFGHAVLAAIDSAGNIQGQDASFATVSAGGLDLVSEVLPQMPRGIIAYAHPSTSTDYPSGHIGTTEGAVFEMDCDVEGGRAYRVTISDISIETNAAGHRAFVRVRYTTSGATPTTSSTVLTLGYADAGATNFLRPGAFSSMFFPASDCTARFLVTLESRDGSPEYSQFDDGAFSVEDVGLAVGNDFSWIGSGTSGSVIPSPKSYTKTYTATHTYSYQGGDGGNPNARINTDGTMYVGGDSYNTYNGRAKTWILFPSGIASDLAGASVTSTQLKLNNNHTWYGSGMDLHYGWDTRSSFPGSLSNPGGADTDVGSEHFNQGQTKTFALSGSIGIHFRDDGARSITLFRNSNSLQSYGFFAGANQNGPPQLIIKFKK